MSLDRRGFLRHAGLALGGAAAGAAGAGTFVAVERPPSAAAAEPAAAAPPAFQGAHQAGILTPLQRESTFVSFDLTTTSAAQLKELLHTLTVRARFLTSGGTPPNLGISAPPSDSGVLGPTVVPGNLTATVSLGASAFDGRFGLAAKKPARLRAMDTFPDDDLDRARCDGDLLLQLCADDRDVVLHALRDIARATRGGLQVRWRQDGFLSPPRPSGTPRNLMGFADGVANPSVADTDQMNALVWVQPGAGEPSWATGGTYHVVRLIRMRVEFWDRVTITEQERMIGRRRDTGAPLSGSVESDLPDYTDDPIGSTIPLDAHIRLANPRTAQTDPSRILRRGYNYDAGTDTNGNLDMGLVFTCFQQDLDRGFVAVQKRLAGEPLVDYVSPYGGGYFFALPGVRSASDWYGRSLFA